MENNRLFFAVCCILLFVRVCCASPADPVSETRSGGRMEGNFAFADDGSGRGAQDGMPGDPSGADDAGLDAGDDDPIPPEETWQRFEWEEARPEYVLRYEVVVEEYLDGDGAWREIRRMFTEGNETYAYPSELLPPGNYRYKIITYNLLNIPEVESDWFGVKIMLAHRPEIRSVSVQVNRSSTLYLDEWNDGVVVLGGRDLYPPPTGGGDVVFTEYRLTDPKKKRPDIVPEVLEHDDDNRGVRLAVDLDSLDIGTYHFIATDISGLSSEPGDRNALTVKFRKAVDFDVSVGYVLPVVLFDDTLEHYMESSVWPLSVTARCSFMPFKRRFGYFGVGLSGSYTRMSCDTEDYSIDGNLITAHLNFVYQFPVNIRKKGTDRSRHLLTLEFHGGVGGALFNNYMFHFPHDIDSEPLDSLNLSVDAGLAVQVYFTRRFYSEVCVDYVMSFISDMSFGMIMPSVSVGWQF